MQLICLPASWLWPHESGAHCNIKLTQLLLRYAARRLPRATSSLASQINLCCKLLRALEALPPWRRTGCQCLQSRRSRRGCRDVAVAGSAMGASQPQSPTRPSMRAFSPCRTTKHRALPRAPRRAGWGDMKVSGDSDYESTTASPHQECYCVLNAGHLTATPVAEHGLPSTATQSPPWLLLGNG